MNRRRLLTSLGLGATLATAGCVGGDGESATDAEATAGSATASATPTVTPDPTRTEPPTATPERTETRTPRTTTAGDRTTATVEMTGVAFSPVRLSVDPPVTVEWINRDPYAHNVDSARFHDVAAEWDYFSGDLGEGQSGSHTFDESGVYEYVCTIHGKSTMCGVVLVGDVTLDEKLPCEE